MKENQPLVSVIICCYNAEKYLPRCLDSLVRQSYRNLEIIIVDDGSTENEAEIFADYQALYPSLPWKFIRHDRNRGLFRARISGFEASRGDYIAFVDADDRVSCDFYRLLVERAEETGADMTACEIVFENPKGEMWQYPLLLLQMAEGEAREGNLLDFFYRNEGKCCSLQITWNKLYRRELYEKAYPYLNGVEDCIVMLEDYLAANVFFALAKSLAIAPRSFYYYYKGEDASMSLSIPAERVEKNIRDLGLVFARARELLEKLGRYEEVRAHVENFRKLYYRMWARQFAWRNLPALEKRKLQKLLEETLPANEDASQAADDYHYSAFAPFHDRLEQLKREIVSEKTKCVSFDIFDTLVTRPFFYPTDLFHLLDEEFSEAMGKAPVSFAEMRVRAETEARKRLRTGGSAYEDVTLDEIYEAFQDLSGAGAELADRMERLELALELRFCQQRKIGKELYSLAKSVGKRVVFTSDMYLPRETVEKILEKTGYGQGDELFLSSERKVTKATGELYGAVLRGLGIRPEELLHIGDNGWSDGEAARKNGCRACQLPRTVNVFQGEFPELYNGGLFRETFWRKDRTVHASALEFWGLRCLLAVIANRLFDNPFAEWNLDSWCNASPYALGYAALGPEIYGIALWLHEKAKAYRKIHFIARDGYLLQEAFRILFPETAADYLRVSRKSLMPLDVREAADFPNLRTQFNSGRYTPGKVIALLAPILPGNFDAERFCQTRRWLPEKNFHSVEEADDFLFALGKEIAGNSRQEAFREEMERYFGGLIQERECTFDSGYSGRTERILTRLLGFPVDAFYVHLNNDMGLVSAARYGFRVDTFFLGTPAARGVLREMLLSEPGPSCTGYEKDKNGEMRPKFEAYRADCPQEFILKLIHQGTLDFIRDCKEIFGDDLKRLPLRVFEMAQPLETFLYSAPDADRKLFAAFDFEDDIGVGRVNVYDFWNQQTWTQAPDVIPAAGGITWDWLPKWKKAAMYAMLDRKMLKIKMKEKYAGHPFLLGAMGSAYRSARKIYHLFR